MAHIICYNVDTVVYVDESGVDEYYGRDYGRAMIGVRVEDTKRGKRFARTNVVAGLLGKKHIAVQTYNHATTAVFFEDWFEWELLAATPENALVVIDNASFHRKNRLLAIAARYGIHILFLPPYSPDYNAIEPSWANLKRWLSDNRKRFPNNNLAIECYFGVY